MNPNVSANVLSFLCTKVEQEKTFTLENDSVRVIFSFRPTCNRFSSLTIYYVANNDYSNEVSMSMDKDEILASYTIKSLRPSHTPLVNSLVTYMINNVEFITDLLKSVNQVSLKVNNEDAIDTTDSEYVFATETLSILQDAFDNEIHTFD